MPPRLQAVRLRRWRIAILAVLCLAACRTSAPRLGPAQAALAALPQASPSERPAGQWLIRAELAGEAGTASLKLLIRRWSADRFQLQISDSLGQSRGELLRDGRSAIWIDPQRGEYCRLAPELPLRGSLPLPSLAVAELPGLLLEEWPEPSRVVAGEGARATERQPFTGVALPPESARPGRWERWTLWQGGAPVAWFRRQGEEALLSVRRPAIQMRWRIVASSGRPNALPAARGTSEAGVSIAEPPADARQRSCPDNAVF